MYNFYKKAAFLSFCLMSFLSFAFTEHQTSQTTSYMADSYTGIDLDVSVGGSALRAKFVGFEANQPPDRQNYGGLGYALQGKLGASYGFCENWVVGFDGYAQYNSADAVEKYTESSTGSSVSRIFKINWSFGLDAKIGVVSSLSGLVFIYGGPDWGHYDFKVNIGIPEVNTTITEYKLGGRFGAGFEQKLTKSWFLRSTFDYTWYPSKTFTGIGDDIKVSPNLMTFLFHVGYLF